MKRFRGGLVFKAHRLLYHSTLGLRVIKKKRRYLRDVLLGLGKVELVRLLEGRQRALELARRHRVEDDPLALQPVHK